MTAPSTSALTSITHEAGPEFLGRLEHALKAVAPRIGPATLSVFLGDPGLERLAAAGLLTDPERLAAFLAQCAHESTGFTARVENLNYSAEGIATTWPSRFPTPHSASHLARRPAALANSVYRGRNGNVDPDDGWRYRGRGFIQITGRRNYQRIGELLGWPLVDKPAMAEDPAGALATATAFWQLNTLNAFVDRRDFSGLTRAINGGLKGLSERRALLQLARSALNG